MLWLSVSAYIWKDFFPQRARNSTSQVTEKDKEIHEDTRRKAYKNKILYTNMTYKELHLGTNDFHVVWTETHVTCMQGPRNGF